MTFPSVKGLSVVYSRATCWLIQKDLATVCKFCEGENWTWKTDSPIGKRAVISCSCPYWENRVRYREKKKKKER